MNKNFVMFSAPRTAIPNVHVLRGATSPKLEGGYAKWDVVDRPKRRGATIYTGSDPARMSIPIIFDGWDNEVSQEPKITSLERMRREAGRQPPTIKVTGAIPLKGATWVIESISYGDDVTWLMKGGVGVRVRQDATVNLLEFVATQLAAFSNVIPGNTRGSSHGSKQAPYVVRAGDSLTSIAVKRYHDRKQWKKIGDANGIRDPNDVTAGQILVIP